MKLVLGYDIGSSSIKASLVDVSNGKCLINDYSPKTEMKIESIKNGFAEQDVEEWWKHVKEVTKQLLHYLQKNNIPITSIQSIGISYQMHGIVLIDSKGNVLRKSIIWCDSRGVEYGKQAEEVIGKEFCQKHLLNLPGNFTATKLYWIKENEPEIFQSIYKVLLPGDYIAYRMTGKPYTTQSGLSEGMLWDYEQKRISQEMLDWLGLREDQFGEIIPTFGYQGELLEQQAKELGLISGIPITYRAGDQPNNAFSLGVLHPGEVASTAGTSGVVYGITDKQIQDSLSRINAFLHVNNSILSQRIGMLLCINGTGCLYSYLKKLFGIDYNEMNEEADKIPIGSDGLIILPFGNGSERMLENKSIGCSIEGLNFNIHSRNHIIRAAQEGIVCAFAYGIEQMRSMGMKIEKIKAGKSNLFKSELFVKTLAGITNTTIELYNTDGSIGAALASGVGCKLFQSPEDAISSLEKISSISIPIEDQIQYQRLYSEWKQVLLKKLNC